MSSNRFRRRSIAGAAATLSIIVAAGLSAGPASAYSTPTGSATGLCNPATQYPTIGQTATAACSFSFVKGDGKTGYSGPVNYVVDNSAGISGTAASSGASSAAVTFPVCATTGTTNYTVTATTPTATSQVFVSVTCGKATPTVTPGTCTSIAPKFGFNGYSCTFTTNVGDGTAVTFSPSDTDNAYTFGGSKSVSGGAFYTKVYVDPNVSGISVTATTAASTTAASASGTDTVN